MPDTPSPHTVFVSHAHTDNELCDRYVEALRKRGLDLWYDRTNLQAGHSLSSDIEAELRRRTAFVVIATPASLVSQWVRSEIAAFRYLAAKDSTHLFLPVRAAECDMPLLWADILWIDAVSVGFEAAVDAMAKTLGAPSVRAAAPPTPTPQPLKRAIAPTDWPAMEQPTSVDGDETEDDQPKLWTTMSIQDARKQLERARRGEPGAKIQQARALFQSEAWDNQTATAWSELGEAYYYIGFKEDALAALDRALARDNKRSRDWQLKAQVLRALGRTREAEEAERRYEKLKKK